MIDSGGLTEVELLFVNSWKGKAMAKGVLSAPPRASFFSESFVGSLFGKREAPVWCGICSAPFGLVSKVTRD